MPLSIFQRLGNMLRQPVPQKTQAELEADRIAARDASRAAQREIQEKAAEKLRNEIAEDQTRQRDYYNALAWRDCEDYRLAQVKQNQQAAPGELMMVPKPLEEFSAKYPAITNNQWRQMTPAEKLKQGAVLPADLPPDVPPA